MDLIQLVRNFRESAAICSSWGDVGRRILWIYGDRLPRWITSKTTRTISFSYPSPVGNIELALRVNHGSDAFIHSEVFHHRYYDFDLPFLPETILDLGANAGFTTIFFGRKYSGAHIACVEPISENLDALKTNLELNGVTATVFPAAIAVEDGYLQMTLSENQYGHKVSGIPYGKALTGLSANVDAISILTILDRLRWQRISLLKVDIEGYEGVLLKEPCEWLSKVDAMCIECHEGYGEEDLRKLAEGNGFRGPFQLPGIWLLIRNIKEGATE